MSEKGRSDNRPKVFTLEEAADLLRVSHSTLYRAAQAGEVPAFKLRSQWRFPAHYIESMLDGGDTFPRPNEEPELLSEAAGHGPATPRGRR
ncbi:helix-turn-helix domain-containing protein [Atopobiaceae bacterium FL090493]|nr:helix-turn-helix domain-containing protein [Atopobiaceae bacterium FL090493]